MQLVFENSMNSCAKVYPQLIRAFSLLVTLPRLKHTVFHNRTARPAQLADQSLLRHHSRGKCIGHQTIGRFPLACESDLPHGMQLLLAANRCRQFSHSTSMATSEGMTGAVVVYVTVPNEEVAEKVATLLVNPDHRLAACVNIVPGADMAMPLGAGCKDSRTCR